MSKELIESVKEMLRLVVFGALSAGLTVAIDYLSQTDLSGQVEATIVAVTLLVLRGVDKWVHENAGRFKKAKGLLPF